MEGRLPSSIRSALLTVAERLAASEMAWLVGGSCGLLLQNVAVQKHPNDIDLYVNRDNISRLHAKLLPYALEEPQYSETPIYRSTLSHYDVNGHTVELVGGFEVETLGSLYRVDIERLMPYTAVLHLDGAAVPLMPLGHELLFNLLRDRPDRFEAIADTIRQEPNLHLPALKELLASDRWSKGMCRQVEALLEM